MLTNPSYTILLFTMGEPVIFHVDMDAFYAAVEQTDFPAYRGKPVIIGATPGHRGVVSACSYEARAFGVHSAMPISEAVRRCPQGIYLPVRMKRYQEVSSLIMGMFYNFTPDIRQISIDEAFLDMTGTQNLFGPPEEAALQIKRVIKENTGLTISIGIAQNRFLAKLASDYKKPDGLFRVSPDQVEDFINSLELKDLWGIGKKTVEQLRKFGISSTRQLRSLSLPALQHTMGKGAGEYLYKGVRGIDPGVFREEVKNRSISNEKTFETDIRHREALDRTLLELSHQVMFRLLESKYLGRTIFIKIRYSDFSCSSAQTTLPKPVSSTEELYSNCRSLLDKRLCKGAAVRLIGVGLSSLQPIHSGIQGDLFEDTRQKQQAVETAVLKIRAKGNHLTKAGLLKPKTDSKTANHQT